MGGQSEMPKKKKTLRPNLEKKKEKLYGKREKVSREKDRQTGGGNWKWVGGSPFLGEKMFFFLWGGGSWTGEGGGKGNQ